MKNRTPPKKTTSASSSARDPDIDYSDASPAYAAAKKRLDQALKARQSGLKEGNPYYASGKFDGQKLDADKLLVIRVESAALGISPAITEAGIEKAKIKGGGIRDGVVESFTKGVLTVQQSDAAVGNEPDDQRTNDIINSLKNTKSGGLQEKELIRKLQGEGFDRAGLPGFNNADGTEATLEERLSKATGVAQAGGDIYNVNDYAAYDALQTALAKAGVTDDERNAAVAAFQNSVTENEATGADTGSGSGADTGTGTGTGTGTDTGTGTNAGTGANTGDGFATGLPGGPDKDKNTGTTPTTTDPEQAPSNPEPTPATPEPAPSTPEPVPSNPEPAPSNPEPTPSNPEPTPSNPEPAPSNPEPTPSDPELAAPAQTDPNAGNRLLDSEPNNTEMLWSRDHGDGTETQYVTDKDGDHKRDWKTVPNSNATLTINPEEMEIRGGEEDNENSDDENGDDENGGDENSGDENNGDENNDDENSDDENGDDENGDDENSDDENGDDENGGDDENSGDENSDDENNDEGTKPVNPNYDDGTVLNRKTDLEIWQEKRNAQRGIETSGSDSDLGAGEALNREDIVDTPRRRGPDIDYEDQPTEQSGTYIDPLNDNDPQGGADLGQKAIDAAEEETD